MDSVDRDVIQRLAALRGVLKAVLLEARDRGALIVRRTPEAAENAGVAEVLSRPRIVCLFKDPTFRPPPEPTLLLVDEAGGILGREILPGESVPDDRRVAHLGKDFVLFAGVRPHGRYRFLLPPVRFPELERFSALDRIVSASPDSPQDDYLRERFAVPTGQRYASVLVGYAVRNA
ncbi:MAG TPA: hypothetical protein VEY12_08830 [Thermoplasmata archaeon]|nr:hypothetical protein [Thermoplasmata archaeon]